MRESPEFYEGLISGLIAYAEHQFWLDAIPKDQAISRRKSLEQVEKSLGRKPKELANAPEPVEGTDYLWHLFCDLKSAGPISFSEMRAYEQMTGVNLTPFEVDCMRRLDEAWARARQ